MSSLKIFHKKDPAGFRSLCAMLLGLVGRLAWLMLFRSEYYYKKAADLHERERDIKAARGRIWMLTGQCWRIISRSVRSLWYITS